MGLCYTLNMNEFLTTILKIISRLETKPVVYGSFGVATYLNDFKEFEDIDILVESEFINDKWPEFKKLFESSGFNLVDEKEHEFELDGKRVGFASKDILLRDNVINDYSELIQYKDKEAFTLTPYSFLKAYKFSVKDGYRIKGRCKKDRDIIRKLESYIN